MTHFISKNKFFELNVFQEISGIVIDTNSPLKYTRIFMDRIETKFEKIQSHQPVVWFR